MKKTICVVTSSRADYGILYWVLKEIQEDPDLELQLAVTGDHLVASHGDTAALIEKDGFSISARVDVTQKDDSAAGICRATGLGIEKFGALFATSRPDLLCVLGDRYEIFASVVAAHIHGIPIAHIHGGEISEGAIDDAFRHSMTKMSGLHFTSTEKHRQRVIQLGENPEFVFNFGAPGLDHCFRSKLMTREELETSLGFAINKKTALVTYHPVTRGDATSAEFEIDQVLGAVEKSGLRAVFTRSNADTHGQLINEKIQEFCAKNPVRFKFFDNLGQVRYLSALKYFGVMVGNSSSGIIEAASFTLPVVNIGDRQKGRERGANVLDSAPLESAILQNIKSAFNAIFLNQLLNLKNPYQSSQSGKTSHKIKETIKEFVASERIDQIRLKAFIDL